MNRNLSVLADKEYDLVIIGGGIFGACAAWDAALRGLSVALVEKDDYCEGTSANSFKMVHGGIRYLQHADVVRIWQSCHERSALLKIAPHLVQPLPIVIPTYGHGKNGKALLTMGVWAYDLLTLGRNREIQDPDRRIPWGRTLDCDRVLELFPGLKAGNLTGAVLFHDGQMYNPTRLVISFLRSAVSAGAEIANYVEAVGFLRRNDRILGIEAEDRLTSERFQIRAKFVLNAAGPWAESLLATTDPQIRLRRKTVFSRDACFVVPRRSTHPYALAVQGHSRDPDAILSRDARHLFVVPWRDYSLIGVWHMVYDGDPQAFTVTEEELETFIDEVNWAHPPLDLKRDQVLTWNAGLVPFGENQPGAVDLSYGKRSIIIDHARQHHLDGLVTLIGVRYTTARGEASHALDVIARKLKHSSPRPATDSIPIHGGRIEHFETFVKQTAAQLSLVPSAIRPLLHNYGSEYGRVLKYLEEDASWAQTVGISTVIKAEIVHAVREEMAQKLSDVVFRRTDLATGEHPGKDALQTCAQLMGNELDWSASRTHREIEEVGRQFPFPCRKQDQAVLSQVSSAL